MRCEECVNYEKKHEELSGYGFCVSDKVVFSVEDLRVQNIALIHHKACFPVVSKDFGCVNFIKKNEL